MQCIRTAQLNACLHGDPFIGDSVTVLSVPGPVICTFATRKSRRVCKCVLVVVSIHIQAPRGKEMLGNAKDSFWVKAIDVTRTRSEVEFA